MDSFSWSKKIFSNTYTISKNGESVGYMKGTEFLSKTSQARLFDNEYTFVSENWNNTKVKIYKKGKPEHISDIKFNGFKSRAEISYQGEIYELKFLDIWQSKWQISINGKSILMSSKSSLSGGQADIGEDHKELLLIALYTSNYFYTIGFLLVIIVIILVISN